MCSIIFKYKSQATFETNGQTCKLNREKFKHASRAPEHHITGFVLASREHTLRLGCASARGEPSWWHICFRHREAHSCLFSLLTSQMMLMLKQPDGLALFARNQKPRDPDSKWRKKWGEVKGKKCTKLTGLSLFLLRLWLLFKFFIFFLFIFLHRKLGAEDL